ncbi:unnamed protein product, partial [Cladocopium goreaui]
VVRRPTTSAGAAAAASALPEMDAWAAQRTAQQCLSIKYVEDLAEADLTATPLDEMLQASVDPEPWRIDRGTKDAYLRGRRRFKGGLTSLARKPQLPISGPSGTGFAVSDPWHTLQDRQCHIVVNGSVWVGQFAVPNNCVICTCIGSGCVALGGGDYDGDLLMFTSDPALLAFLEFTNGGRKLPEFVAARGEIERHVKSVQFKPLPLTSIMHYRHHCLTTPTPQIRGLLTAMAEKTQQAAFESLAPHRDGSLIRAVRLAVAAEKAYDAPKKVNAKAIIELGHTLLRDACLQMNSPRSTISLRPLFLYAQGAPQLDPEKVLCNCMPKFN